MEIDNPVMLRNMITAATLKVPSVMEVLQNRLHKTPTEEEVDICLTLPEWKEMIYPL